MSSSNSGSEPSSVFPICLRCTQASTVARSLRQILQRRYRQARRSCLPASCPSTPSVLVSARRYVVTMIKNGVATPLPNATGNPLYVVPANVGPRTMNYNALFDAGTYDLSDSIKVFAGTTDDAFWIDLGGAFDTLNTSVQPPVLTAAQDAANVNLAADTVSGYAVNSIAIEVPISMLTRTGVIESATSPAATIGIWGTTSRPRTTVRRAPLPAASGGGFSQIQRVGNPLINELLIGTGFKDRFSMEQPKNDAQFANQFFLDPSLAQSGERPDEWSCRHPGSATNGSASGRDLRSTYRRARNAGRSHRRSVEVEHRRRSDTAGERQPIGLARWGCGRVSQWSQGVRRRDRHRAPIGRRWRPRGTTVFYFAAQQQAGRWCQRQRCTVSHAVPLSRERPKRTKSQAHRPR